MSESTIYRSSTIAQCLSSSVDELVADDRLDADTADAIMDQFDKVRVLIDHRGSGHQRLCPHQN